MAGLAWLGLSRVTTNLAAMPWSQPVAQQLLRAPVGGLMWGYYSYECRSYCKCSRITITTTISVATTLKHLAGFGTVGENFG